MMTIYSADDIAMINGMIDSNKEFFNKTIKDFNNCVKIGSYMISHYTDALNRQSSSIMYLEQVRTLMVLDTDKKDLMHFIFNNDSLYREARNIYGMAIADNLLF